MPHIYLSGKGKMRLKLLKLFQAWYMRKGSICIFQVDNQVDPPRIVVTKGFIQQKRCNMCIQELKPTISKGHITLKHFTNIEKAWRPRHLPKAARTRVAAGKLIENLWSLEEPCCPFVISAYLQYFTLVFKATSSSIRFLFFNQFNSILQSSTLLPFLNTTPYLTATLLPLAV